MLYYCPMECRLDRYSWQLSAPKVGWNERAWQRLGIEYCRVEPELLGVETQGTVFDMSRRSEWCLVQSAMLVRMISEGRIKPTDWVYFEDALHPGISAFGMLKERPKLSAWLHGSAYDPEDMLAKEPWAALYEGMALRILDKTFVACPELQKLVQREHKIRTYPTGHVWDTDEVKSRFPGKSPVREDMVVYASRWDACKRPMLFLDVARRVKAQRPLTKFVVCSSSEEIRSDELALVDKLRQAESQGLVEVHTGISKEEYYYMLTRAKVIFSSAMMDWTSYVLLEGACAGAIPVFPYNWCYKDALSGFGWLYSDGNAHAASEVIQDVLARNDLWTDDACDNRSWIYKRFDTTWDRRLDIMDLRECPAEHWEIWS